MTRDELEFSISQYLDGTLAAGERDALDERFATDAEARALLAEYEALQGVLSAAPAPEVRWDEFAARVSGAVAREAMPTQSYRMSQWFRPARLALAASVLLAGAVAFSVIRPNGTATTDTTSRVTPVEPTRIVAVDPAPAAPTALASAAPVDEPIRIAIGPPAAGGDAPLVLRYADSVVQRPSKAVIVSAGPPGQDGPLTPF